ncbi:MAG: hypothetical protein NUV31_11225, partial [Dehalococcoidales bacterium]|nr:hypothetical protein [Dehalococcoidales bacterium]
EEAEVGLIERQNEINRGLMSRPNLKGAIDDITTRMYAGSGKGMVGGNPWIDFGKEMYKIQKGTKSRIGDLWRLAYDKNLENGVVLSNFDAELEASVPRFKAIANDKAALQRINDYIASKNKWANVPYPENITADEIKIAQIIERQFMSFQNDVRFHRFYDAYHEFDGSAILMQTKIKDAPLEDLNEAINLYETKGADALADYLKTKTWGIIESGYEPHIVVNPKLQLHKIKATVLSKGRLKSREGVEFEPGDLNILQRRETYIKQMLSLKLEPYFRAMDREFQKIAPQLKNPGEIANGIDLAIRELRGYHTTEVIEKMLMRTQGYAFSTLALAPHMTVRNVLQVLLQPNLQALLKTF